MRVFSDIIPSTPKYFNVYLLRARFLYNYSIVIQIKKVRIDIVLSNIQCILSNYLVYKV